MKRKVTILLAEDIASVNKGEAAILFGMLESFRVFEDWELVLLSTCREDFANYNVERCRVVAVTGHKAGNFIRLLAVYIRKFILMSLLGSAEAVMGRGAVSKLVKSEPFRSFVEADVIIVGHDNVFAFVPPSVPNLLPVVFYAKLTGKKIVAYGATVGPFIHGSAVRLFFSKSLLLNNIDLYTVRDNRTIGYMKELGITRPRIELTADLAFLMGTSPPEAVDEYLNARGIYPPGKLIGITACRFLAEKMERLDGRELKSPEEKYEAYTALISGLADKMIEETGATILLIAHVIGPTARADDRTVNDDIFRKIRNREHVLIVNDDLSAPMLKGIIAKTELMVGARTHSIIAASSLSVPVVGFTDSHRFKTNGIIGDQLNQGRFLIAVEDMATDDVIATVAGAYKNRLDIRKELLARMKEVKASALRNGSLLLEFAGK